MFLHRGFLFSQKDRHRRVTVNNEWLRITRAVHFPEPQSQVKKISRKKTKIYLVEWYCCYTFVEIKIMIWKI